MGHLRSISVIRGHSPLHRHLLNSAHTPLGFYRECWFNLNYCYSSSTKGEKGLYLQKFYFIFFYKIHLHLSYLGLPEFEERVYFYLVLFFLHVLSLSFSISIHTCACQCMPVDTPRCKYVCAHVYAFFIVYVYTRICKDSNNLKILELNPFFGPSHFILETFPDKWPFTVSLNHPCVRSSLWYKGVPVTRTPVIVGKHFLLLSGNPSPAAPACSSRCILCGRIQESPSPSSSCLVETMTSVPPAPFCLWSHMQTPGLGLGTVPRVIVSLLMPSSRQPEKNVFRGFFKNNS